MTDHPSTFQGSTTQSGEAAWDDRARIVSADQSGKLDGGGIPLLRGTFAEMIRHMAQLPEDDRAGYVIEKAGDRAYSAEEAMALASRPDFPPEGTG
ncbi:hypothetical protein [Erythrobacter colymbi]|uniref:hypothetical protein n=1 Tax=Erythrobacter colymbi TaxID=1161202 RepID=UPI000A37051B|nr:hypothetical protein [Erythrobacter colymbi]